MRSLSELEMRILSELEEFGRENIPTLINTVTEPTNEDGARVEFGAALLSLLEARLINVAAGGSANSPEDSLSKDDASMVLTNIDDYLAFDASRGVWTGRARPWPEIVATSTGREQAWKLLDERGYQWWLRTANPDH